MCSLRAYFSWCNGNTDIGLKCPGRVRPELVLREISSDHIKQRWPKTAKNNVDILYQVHRLRTTQSQHSQHATSAFSMSASCKAKYFDAPNHASTRHNICLQVERLRLTKADQMKQG
jgi:hypothetical protein